MREMLRLLILFLVASAALMIAFGTGFSTGNQLAGAGAIDLPDVLEARRQTLAGIVADARAGRDPEPEQESSDAAAGSATPSGGDGVAAGDSGTAGAQSASAQAPGSAPAPAQNAFDIFWDAWRVVHEEYAGELPEAEALTYGAIRGSLRVLDDPYTMFTDPVVNEVRRVELEGEFEGIGAFVAQNAEGQLVIQTPMRGQPAERAGILAGDIVLAVDGVEITGMDVNESVLLIRGEKGTEVVLTIAREDVAEPFDVTVVRDRIDIPSVNTARLLEAEGAPQVGYIELTVFAAETRDELVAAIAEVRQAGAEAIILDLRNNPGGFLNAAVGVASEFLESGVVTYREDARGTRRAERVTGDGTALDVPLVVLINRGSASASEIVAGAVQDYGRGVIVGERSFGKGSVQNVHDLSDGSQLRVTVEIWLTPHGNTIQGGGVAPDVVVTPEPVATAEASGTLEDDEGLDSQVGAGPGSLEGEPADGEAGSEAGEPIDGDLETTDGEPAAPEGDGAPGSTGETGSAEPPDAQLLRAIEEALALLSGRAVRSEP